MKKYGVPWRFKGICACTVVALLACGCGQAGEETNIVVVDHEDAGVAYDFGVAEIGDVIKTQKTKCTYRQMNGQEVSFSTSGKLINKVYVEEGQSVKKGDLLAELSAGDLDRQIETLKYNIARNELLLGYTDINEEYELSGHWVNYLYFTGMSDWDKENLDNNLENTKKNYRYQREDCTDALTLDRQKLETLQNEVRSSRAYASMDGVVYNLKERLEGSTSKKDEVIMTIMDTSECLFEIEAPELAQYFHEGETVEMSIAYGTGAGTYELVPWDMANWQDTQQFVVFDGPDSAVIEVGTSGTMLVVTGKKTNVLCVPADTVFSADGKAYVYVLGADNMREVKWVETGLYGDSTVEILDGLAEGDKVIRK